MKYLLSGKYGILALLLASSALVLTGCGGIGATHSVSPASFFIPGLVENTPNSSFEEYLSHTQTGKSISDTQLEFFSSDNLKVICSNTE